jgi:hypothetical protein
MRYLQKRVLWLGLALLVTLMTLVVYVAVQQSLRIGANEPQRSMAQDVARDLENHKQPQSLTNGYIDMRSNMAPFIIIYDKFGKVVAGNGYLDNSIPQVPIGTLAATKGHKINAVTWQPADKVRIASVSVEAGDYYVLGGRSLSIVEKQIRSFTQWTLSFLAASLVVIYLGYRLAKPKARTPKRLEL